jgi:hypothetical protein
MGSDTPPPAASALGPIGKPRNVLVCIMVFVVTLSLYGLYWVWCAHQEIRRRAATGVGDWLGLVINLVVPFVTLILVPHEAKQMYEREGERSPVSAWTGVWNPIPLVGSIIWLAKVQGALNRFWETRDAEA